MATSILHIAKMDNSEAIQDPNRTSADDGNFSSSFDLESMDPEQRQKLEEELKTELAKVSEFDSSLHYHHNLS